MQWCRWAGSWKSQLPTQTAGPEIEDSFDFLFKIILVGDSDVGKTCVVQSFKSGIFIEKQQNTIGVDFTVRTLDIDGKKVKMQVWDTAGQERFRTITQSYYRSAHGAMVAYDITRRSTFESVPHWIREVELYGAASVVLILIGNKSDLHTKRQVLFEDACNLAEDSGVLAALETSAKEAQNIEAAFILMARELMARNGMTIINESSENSPQFMLSNNSHPVPSAVVTDKKCGCREG
ncbi:ras-related protein Rab-19 isoform X1 [Maylandia zebra]|uniref:Ras-related protein Rab-19 n=2 Tax=Haplochromini TaxID=319058 RepID=A0A9Y6M6I1_9CICH|nr:ras-related protein Rab-19 [Maylandia zebra]XP_005734925.1 PREDICTED: ras-related protein Rab-19-like [Pundamilia nyererei]XP_005734926.1 PREDICTED: ras-related protein Rab-19-like [Pundamilia nyererei]XP_013766784.1 PREDICTED: ras-related protein Rab-19-like [Pundamilia nyererei]XP_013766785.1 PREDICTED: ras-related protein Rab-19-like [Pundamilia nyererei]XP_026032312.1 ras-related protein Rab-19-like [Astatotilapia calliptera]XP_039881126.1 ras-related protein Rab-19 isoform X1 [Simochr